MNYMRRYASMAVLYFAELLIKTLHAFPGKHFLAVRSDRSCLNDGNHF